MLRRVSVEQASVTDVSDEYGVSRPTFYQAKADFEAAGIAGLVPKKRGPRGPHKLQSDMLAFIETKVVPGEPIRARELAKLVERSSGLEVHPRTIERALSGKKTRDDPGQPEAVGCTRQACWSAYELLRAAMLGAALPPDSRAGLIVLLHRGMWAWARVIDRIRHGPVSARQRPPVALRPSPANGARSSICSPAWL